MFWILLGVWEARLGEAKGLQSHETRGLGFRV